MKHGSKSPPHLSLCGTKDSGEPLLSSIQHKDHSGPRGTDYSAGATESQVLGPRIENSIDSAQVQAEPVPMIGMGSHGHCLLPKDYGACGLIPPTPNLILQASSPLVEVISDATLPNPTVTSVLNFPTSW